MLNSTHILVLLLGRIIGILVFAVLMSTLLFPYLSKDLCVKDPLLLRPDVKQHLREVTRLFSKSGLDMKLSCSNPFSINLVVQEDLDSAQAIGQTRMNGLVRTVDGEQLFLPILLPLWPFQEIKVRKDYVDTSYFKLIVIHEIGHILGIGHSTDPHNVMYPEIEPQIQPTEAVQHVKELSYVHF